MATNYCIDYVNGSTTGNGTPQAPWSKIRDTSGVTWQLGDTVRIRATSGVTYTGVTWTMNSKTLSMMGADYTSLIPVGSAIRKLSDTNTFYYVSSRTFSGGNTLLTIFNNGDFWYFGPTETVSVEILPSPPIDIDKGLGGVPNGSKRGYSYNDMTEISGGWDETFTVQSGFTYLQHNSMQRTEDGGINYYHWKNLIFYMTASQNWARKSMWFTDCCFIMKSAGLAHGNALVPTSQINLFTRCMFVADNNVITNWNMQERDVFNFCKFYCTSNAIDANYDWRQYTTFSGCTFDSSRNGWLGLQGIHYGSSWGYSRYDRNWEPMKDSTVYDYTLLNTFNDRTSNPPLNNNNSQYFIQNFNYNLNIYNKNSTSKLVKMNNNTKMTFADINNYISTNCTGYDMVNNKIMKNGGFLYIVSGATAYTGNTCIKIENTTVTSTALSSLFKFPVTSGNTYEVSMYVKGSQYATQMVTTIVNAYNIILDSQIDSVSTTWTKKTFTLNSMPTVTGFLIVSITFNATQNVHDFYIDKVELTII